MIVKGIVIKNNLGKEIDIDYSIDNKNDILTIKLEHGKIYK